MTHFTQEDAERIRSDFALVTGVYSAGLVARREEGGGRHHDTQQDEAKKNQHTKKMTA